MSPSHPHPAKRFVGGTCDTACVQANKGDCIGGTSLLSSKLGHVPLDLLTAVDADRQAGTHATTRTKPKPKGPESKTGKQQTTT